LPIPVKDLEKYVGKQVIAMSVPTSLYPEGFKVQGELGKTTYNFGYVVKWVAMQEIDTSGHLPPEERHTEIQRDTVELVPEKTETLFVPTVFTENEERCLAYLVNSYITNEAMKPWTFDIFKFFIIQTMFNGSEEEFENFMNKTTDILTKDKERKNG